MCIRDRLYTDFFKLANTLNEICMIANSDIWLYKIYREQISYINSNPNTIYALTRHEQDMTCYLIDNYCGSHDAFIFKSPINTNILDSIKIKQNLWGSENVVIQELEKYDYKVRNPCKSTIIVHEHKSQLREKNRGGVYHLLSNELADSVRNKHVCNQVPPSY